MIKFSEISDTLNNDNIKYYLVYTIKKILNLKQLKYLLIINDYFL